MGVRVSVTAQVALLWVLEDLVNELLQGCSKKIHSETFELEIPNMYTN